MEEKSGFSPLTCDNPRVLVLGSLPGDRSLQAGEYYGHPSNRFWRVIADLCSEPLPSGYPAKKAMLARNRILLWDVYSSAVRPGSMDADIREGKYNDIAALVSSCRSVAAVALNGKTAEKAFFRYLDTLSAEKRAVFDGLHVYSLPSTSPANARWGLQALEKEWSVIFSV